MQRETRQLLEFRLSVIACGALLVFVLLHAGLGATGVLPWSGAITIRVTGGLVVAVLMLANAVRTWRRRGDLVLSQLTSPEAILIGGLALVGGIVLLGAIG